MLSSLFLFYHKSCSMFSNSLLDFVKTVLYSILLCNWAAKRPCRQLPTRPSHFLCIILLCLITEPRQVIH